MVLYKSRMFERANFWRDVVASVLAIAIAAIIIWNGHAHDLRVWPEYAAAACVLWIAAFLVANRRLQREPNPSATARESLERATRSVDYQIRLMKNVTWWFLMPCTLAVALGLGDMALMFPLDQWREWCQPYLTTIGLVVVSYPAIYWWNQYAVKKALLPLKQELENALKELESEE